MLRKNFKDEIYETVKELDGSLIIKEYPTKSASSNTIKAHLSRLVKRGINPGLVIVDYGDLLKPVVIRKEKRNELTNRVKDHKVKKEELSKKLKEKIDQFKVVNEKKKDIVPEEPQRGSRGSRGSRGRDRTLNSPESIKKKIDELETKIETEVLEHLSQGLNYKEMTKNLFISPFTVRKHIENI